MTIEDVEALKCPKCKSRWFIDGRCKICLYDETEDKERLLEEINKNDASRS
jgi:hypothetical protein